MVHNPGYNDAVFSVRNKRYKSLLHKHAKMIFSNIDAGEHLTREQMLGNGDKRRQEAHQILIELKGFGGNLLKPIGQGKGRAPAGYSRFASDDEAIESKSPIPLLLCSIDEKAPSDINLVHA